jgi:hypothetical protein
MEDNHSELGEFKVSPLIISGSDGGLFSDEKDKGNITINAIEFGGVGLTIGTILWLLRSSGLLSSLLLSYPAWRNIDPLPVFYQNNASSKR